MSKPTDDYNDKVKQSQAAKKAVMAEIDLAERQRKHEESAESRAANQARKDRWNEERKRAWGDGEYGREGGVAPLIKRMKTEGAKGYDTWAAAMGSVVELALAMSEAIHAEVRPEDRLLDLISLVAGVGWQGLKCGVGILCHPGQTASNVSEFFNASLSKKGATLILSDDMLKTSTCDATGKLSFRTTKDLLPTTSTPNMVERMDELNQGMNKAFLASKGYSEVAQNTFHDASGRPLTSSVFEGLKNHPTEGLNAFAQKEQRVKFEATPPDPNDTSSARMRR